jgi:PPOX class probable FMN-dependent enzyme
MTPEKRHTANLDPLTAASMHPSHAITTQTQLDALFDKVPEASLQKEIDCIHPLYREMIEASPFAILATAGPDGLDVSPRGDPPGFVTVLDEKTLLIPERRGNNRVDSLRNIVADPRAALLFLIPGVGETLRVNGRASITADPAILQSFDMDGKLPKCVVVLHVEAVFFQCARAIKRSALWQTPAEPKPNIPSPGAILAALTETIDGEKYDAALPARLQSSLY